MEALFNGLNHGFWSGDSFGHTDNASTSVFSSPPIGENAAFYKSRLQAQGNPMELKSHLASPLPTGFGGGFGDTTQRSQRRLLFEHRRLRTSITRCHRWKVVVMDHCGLIGRMRCVNRASPVLSIST